MKKFKRLKIKKPIREAERKPKPKIVIPKGRWCHFVEGKVPSPDECRRNKKSLDPRTDQCRWCTRFPEEEDWEWGHWDDIRAAVVKGRVDFTRKNGELGRWCDYYEGRLPYSIECQSNQTVPQSIERPKCRSCTRRINFDDWRAGAYLEDVRKVHEGHDLRPKMKLIKLTKKKIAIKK